jgi:hypothetical protein
MNEKKLARFLGWFSIGLGVTEIVAPGTLARLLGTRDNKTLVQGYGVREIVSGVGILSGVGSPTPWVWSRVGGDALDLATLGVALKESSRPANVGIAIAMVAGITVLDVLCGAKLSDNADQEEEVRDYSHYEQRSGYERPRLGRMLG